jgi:hypothetical protein
VGIGKQAEALQAQRVKEGLTFYFTLCALLGFVLWKTCRNLWKTRKKPQSPVENVALDDEHPSYRGTAKDLGAVITPSDELLQKAPCYLEEIDAPDGSSVIVSPCSTGGQIGINPGLIEQFKLQGQIEKRDFEEQDKVRVDLFQF